MFHVYLFSRVSSLELKDGGLLKYFYTGNFGNGKWVNSIAVTLGRNNGNICDLRRKLDPSLGDANRGSHNFTFFQVALDVRLSC